MAKPNFDDPSAWVLERGVTVFNEHFRPEKRRKDAAGNEKVIPARDFKKDDLDGITKNCNERDRLGLHCAVTLGHTTDDPDESKQPPIVGYDRNFRVEFDGASGKHVILADRYIRKDKAEEAGTYPRTSVEHWINSDFFDPIAIVRRTPKLDIPQWHYSEVSANVERYSRARPDLIDTYSVEAEMADDPTGNPDAKAVSPELKELVMQCIREFMAAAEVERAERLAAVGPANGALPARVAPYVADAEKFASEAEKIRYTRQQDEITRLRKDADELKARNARVVAEGRVRQLLAEGYDFGGATREEREARTERAVQKFARLADAEANEYEAEIRECYQRAPVGGSVLHTFEPEPVTADSRTHPAQRAPEGHDEALKYVRRNPGTSYEEALDKVRELRRETA
jgi:hypothetical protein